MKKIKKFKKNISIEKDTPLFYKMSTGKMKIGVVKPESYGAIGVPMFTSPVSTVESKLKDLLLNAYSSGKTGSSLNFLKQFDASTIDLLAQELKVNPSDIQAELFSAIHDGIQNLPFKLPESIVASIATEPFSIPKLPTTKLPPTGFGEPRYFVGETAQFLGKGPVQTQLGPQFISQAESMAGGYASK